MNHFFVIGLGISIILQSTIRTMTHRYIKKELTYNDPSWQIGLAVALVGLAFGGLLT